MRSSNLVGTIVLLIVASGLSRAQEAGYRIDMMTEPAGFVRMRFVNDSAKDIDAYHVLIKCELSTRETGGDVLYGPHNGGDTIRASGGMWDTGPAIQEDGRVCDATADAVIYSDGSFDGPVEIVRRMQAAREGGFAAIQFWAALLAKPDQAGADSFSTLAKERVKEDRTHLQSCRTSATGEEAELICFYWSGRLHDDGSISGILARPVPPDNDSPWRFENFVRIWMQKYKNDVAMSELSRSFPPVSIHFGQSNLAPSSAKR
jgi:hypothetical protein